MPGTYTSQSWPIDPNHTAILGPGQGYNNPAGGDEAFTVPSTASDSGGTILRGITVTGTIKFNPSNNRNFTLADLIVRNTSDTNDSGRGIEILSDSFLYSAQNLVIPDRDGPGWYSEHDGQSHIENVNVLNCNAGPQDVTSLTVPKFAIELDDGTNTSSGNVGLAVHWGGWTYMN